MNSSVTLLLLYFSPSPPLYFVVSSIFSIAYLSQTKS